MIAETIPALRSLSADDKILLAAELWQEAVGEQTQEPNPALVQALRQRLDYYREHPDEVSTWEDVRNRITSRRK